MRIDRYAAAVCRLPRANCRLPARLDKRRVAGHSLVHGVVDHPAKRWRAFSSVPPIYMPGRQGPVRALPTPRSSRRRNPPRPACLGRSGVKLSPRRYGPSRPQPASTECPRGLRIDRCRRSFADLVCNDSGSLALYPIRGTIREQIVNDRSGVRSAGQEDEPARVIPPKENSCRSMQACDFMLPQWSADGVSVDR